MLVKKLVTMEHRHLDTCMPISKVMVITAILFSLYGKRLNPFLILSTNGTMNWNYTIMLAISCAVLENQLELQETLLK